MDPMPDVWHILSRVLPSPDLQYHLVFPKFRCALCNLLVDTTEPTKHLLKYMLKMARNKNKNAFQGCVPIARYRTGGGGSPCQRPPGQRPPLWTEWHTGVKTLPCPKLRLRAVTKVGTVSGLDACRGIMRIHQSPSQPRPSHKADSHSH